MNNKNQGFTLIELIIVIVITGILAVVAAPRYLDLSSDARIATLEGLKSQMQGTINLAKAKAQVGGLRTVASNPGNQSAYTVDFGFGTSEVDFRNLCPESSAELGDAMDFIEFINLDPSIDTRVTNQHTLLGFDVPTSGTPTNQGCYILYDSFGLPDCTLTLVTTDC